MAAHVAGHELRDDGRQFDGQGVEGDGDLPVGVLMDLVVGQPQDPVQRPGEQQQEQARDAGVAVDGPVVQEQLDATPAQRESSVQP